MKVKINSSFMNLVKARVNDKLGKSKPNIENLQIVETGNEDGIPFIKLNTSKIFFHRDFKNPLDEVYTRYIFSHYEIDKITHPSYCVHRQHTDNLLSLKIDENTRQKLLQQMPIKKGDIVMELGAFSGFATMKLSELVGDKGKVIAVEADSKNYEILSKNIQKNNLHNVITVNKGIWSEKGTLTLFKEKNQRTSLAPGQVANPKNNDEINVDSVDNILRELEIDNIDFISMEINAAEIEGLKGMNKTLNQKSLRLVGAGWYNYEGKPEWKTMKSMLEESGFDVYVGVQNRIFALKQ